MYAERLLRAAVKSQQLPGAAAGYCMSALGHKRTFAVQNAMSALPPKADMCSALADVRFGMSAMSGRGAGGFQKSR